MSILTGLPSNVRAGTAYNLTLDMAALSTAMGLTPDIFWGDINNWKEIQFHFTNSLQFRVISFSKTTTKIRLPKNLIDGAYHCSQIVISDGSGRSKILLRSYFTLQTEFDFNLSGGFSTLPAPESNNQITARLGAVTRLTRDKFNPNYLISLNDTGQAIYETYTQPIGLGIDVVTGNLDIRSQYLNDPFIKAYVISEDGLKAYVIGNFKNKYRNTILPASAETTTPYMRFLEIDLTTGAVTYLFERISDNIYGGRIVVGNNKIVYNNGNTLFCYNFSGTLAWSKYITGRPTYNYREFYTLYFKDGYVYTLASSVEGNFVAGQRIVPLRFDIATGTLDSVYLASIPSSVHFKFLGYKTNDGSYFGYGPNGYNVLHADMSYFEINTTAQPLGIAASEDDNKGYVISYQFKDSSNNVITFISGSIPSGYYSQSGVHALYEITNTGLQLVLTHSQAAPWPQYIGYDLNILAVHDGNLYVQQDDSTLYKTNILSGLKDNAFGSGAGPSRLDHNYFIGDSLFFIPQNFPAYNNPIVYKKDTVIAPNSRHAAKFDIVNKKMVHVVYHDNPYNSAQRHTSPFAPNREFYQVQFGIDSFDTTNEELPYIAKPRSDWPQPIESNWQMASRVVDQYLYVFSDPQTANARATDSIGTFNIPYCLIRIDIATRTIDRQFLPVIPQIASYDNGNSIQLNTNAQYLYDTTNYVYVVINDYGQGYSDARRIYQVKKSNASVVRITPQMLGYPTNYNNGAFNQIYSFDEMDNGKVFVTGAYFGGDYYTGDNFLINFNGDIHGLPFVILDEATLIYNPLEQPQAPSPVTPQNLWFNSVSKIRYFKDENAVYGVGYLSDGTTNPKCILKYDLTTGEATKLFQLEINEVTQLTVFTGLIKIDGDFYSIMQGILNRKFVSGLVKLNSSFTPIA